jgi:diaminopimelate decarboxylase
MSLFPLTHDEAAEIRHRIGTPAYLYDEALLRAAAQRALAFPHAYGLTVRYAMKASPNAAILRLFESMGLSFDASSGYEVTRLLHAGVGTTRISLSTQELPANFTDFCDQGVELNACSLSQLERYGRRFPGTRVGVRFNPGLGSGGTKRTNVGGPASSFGIWHESLPEVRALAERFGLEIHRVHSHIGSGSDPAVWTRAAALTLALARELETVRTVNLGGGYKVARVEGEKSTDFDLVGPPVKALFEEFAAATGRRLHLEIEPGTVLVANAGAILATVQDIVSTGSEGYTFYKLDTGMTEILRPSLYGAQHGFTILSPEPRGEDREVLVVGHCCESGDILTPAPGDPEALAPRVLPAAEIGDFCLLTGAGAYCAAMPAKNYNSFPEAPELWRTAEGEWRVIRRRQDFLQIVENETNERLIARFEDLKSFLD